MPWMVGLLLLVLVGRVQAQETPATGELEDAQRQYDQITVRFNNKIKKFASWDDFKTEVLSRMAPGTPGRCYELTGDAMRPVEVVSATFQPEAADNGWHKTPGHGWRRIAKDRRFVEYRLNDAVGVLLRAEGVKPRFFFSSTKRICEFPLPSQ